MNKFNPNQKPKPDRYVVHMLPERQDTEDIDLYGNIISYSTELDNQPGMTSAYSQAVHTASRYAGEIVAIYKDEKWHSVKTYR